MIGVILSFLGSRLGGWAAAGVVVAVAGLGLYIEAQRVRVAQAERTAAQAERDDALGQLATAEGTNQRQKAQIDNLTQDAAQATQRAEAAAQAATAALAQAKATAGKIKTEIQHVAVPSDDVPSPALGAVLGGLFRDPAGGPQGGDRPRAAPDR